MTQQDNSEAARPRVIAFVEDEPGALARVAEALAEAGINIEDIDGRGAGEYGVISMSTDDDDAALQALLRAGLSAVTSEAVVFHLDDKPGALAVVARRFSDNRLNVRTIHIVHRHAGRAIVAVTTEDDALARTLIGDALLL